MKSFFLCFFLAINTVQCEIITTSLGRIEGKQIDEFHLFKKIPFAKPPLGELRFQKPEKADKWKGVLDATEYGPACMSNSSTTKSPQKWVDEDCLHLNIFTSDHCFKSKNCGVVYYIHGGTLNYDSAVMFNDTYLLDSFVKNDVILVIPAFRLGIFSHFTAHDQTVAPNNVAVYDILLGLEFVKKDIKQFGGDNKKITLFGHSYGGSVTSMLTFSNRVNKDLSLFQQSVSMSAAHDFDTFESQRNRSNTFVEHANCSAPTNLKLTQRQEDLYSLKCLQKKSGLELLRIQRSLEDAGYPKLGGVLLREPLFQEVPYSEYMNSPKRIPVMTGCTRYEMDHDPAYKPIGEALEFENQQEVQEKYRRDWSEGNYDFGNHSDETQAIMVQTWTRILKLSQFNVPAYLYEYTYPKHARHTDDLFYLMGIHAFEKDENEQKLSEVYRKMFTNFVKFGEPGEGFDLPNLENSTYFNVFWNETSGERPQMKSGFEKKIIDYWFKDMVEYDKQVSEMKASKAKIPKMRFYSETSTPHYQFPFFYTSLFLVTLIFLTGCICARCCCSSNRRSLYIKLEGTDDGFHYVKDI